LDQFAEEMAVLLMDSCPSHIAGDMIDFLAEACVRVMTFAPHITQIFQVLDVSLFGVLKRRPSDELPFGDEKATVKFITKRHQDFK
jgi:hypothetical protein